MLVLVKWEVWIGTRRDVKNRGVAPNKDCMDISEPTAFENTVVDINKGHYEKRTALHLAVGEGHLGLVEFLCKSGADVNARDRWVANL